MRWCIDLLRVFFSVLVSHAATDNQTALNKVRAAHPAAFLGGWSFYFLRCVTDYTLWHRVFGPPFEL